MFELLGNKTVLNLLPLSMNFKISKELYKEPKYKIFNSSASKLKI